MGIGLVATVVTNWTTQEIVRRWDSDSADDDEKTIASVLKVLHHPSFADGKSDIQNYMQQTVQSWWQDRSLVDQANLRRQLSKEAVRNGENNTTNYEHTSQGPAKFPGSRPDIKQRPETGLLDMIGGAVGDVAKNIGKGVEDLGKDIGKGVDDAAEAIAQKAMEIDRALEDIKRNAARAAEDLATETARQIEDQMKKAGQSVQEAMNMGKRTIDEVADVFESNWKRVKFW